MGRHSIPEPQDSAGEPPEEPQAPGGDYTDGGHDAPGYPKQDYPKQDYPEPRYEADYGQAGYGEPHHPESQYREADHAQPEYRRPEYPQPEYREPEYRESEYPEPDYRSSAPEESSAAEEPPYPAGPPYSAEPPYSPPPSPPTARQHGGDWAGGDWQGGHRSSAGGRRGVSIGVIAALVTVVLVVAGVILWRFFGDALSNRTNASAARCVGGQEAVAVIADPSIADQVAALAKKFNETANPVGDRCVAIGVKPADSDQVINGFIGNWPADLGDRPALWIPASSVSEARLEAAAGAKTVSDSRSLVTSPVLLAIRPQLQPALAQQNWATLPGLQTNPTALDGLNLPGWGSLRLALPLSRDSDASYLAAEAVAAASAPPGAPASAGSGAVSTLMAGQPKLADTKASTAMDGLLTATDPAAAPVHAVVTTEQQLYQRGTSLPDAKNTVASWLPPGPTATADYPTVLLSGSWLAPEQVSAASEFARFMRKPEQLAELSKAGFRTGGGNPPKSDVTSFSPVSAPLSVGDATMRATLANALTTPAAGPAATIMLDQSMPTNEGGKSRLANVVAALNARLQALPPTSAVGLWTFDGKDGRTEVSTGPLADPVGGQPRSAALTAALNAQSSSAGGAVSFTTLRMIYDAALAKFRQGQTNSVLVITAGPHTDQSLDGQGLQDYVRKTVDPARPVAINVIDFGSDPDRATWEAVAQASGGSYRNPTSSASPDLTSAIATFLA